MKHSAEAVYRASEFARKAGVTVRTLHHYDRLGLLKPSGRTASGYRLYQEHDFARLEQIVTLKFIGFPLKKIRDLLNGKAFDLRATLRLQRKIIEEKRRHLDVAIRAIQDAERAVAAGARGREPDWEVFRKIIEVITMQQNWDWVNKYYTEEQLAQLKQRWSPELQEKVQREWAVLIQEVEAAAAAGEDPASEKAQALAARWQKLIEGFTGGDPGIAQNLRRVYADQANWPATFKKPYSDGAGAFICKAIEARKRN